ncbi:MAG: MmgE/PrpD family protein [Gammaproteobacteria bacterium]|nr:MmgE/PrpD family protein [Gammaproteobacteria bacterium]NIR84988.1 MmgE/PrpD family protein [Gammaproteobacteria bacterium]NIR88255.1 MmgE/PrpD family protein [Gammaproteobacteria bacterium]NIU06035.1 MmgE/PrpD family protein [Gammaproteobacteria bacterium]NIV73454.1 MmgE/PrpD family protein [Gammaproteobacteria bacterium]
MADVTEGLCALLARPVAPEVRERALRHLLDWVGCVAVGAGEPAGRAFGRYAGAQPAGPCTVFGAGARDASTAALANGALGNILEMDDVHRTSIVHAGDVVIPAALAAGERDGASGAALLDALVRGYEAAIRIGTAAGSGHYRYWYNTATCGVFGAAAAVAAVHGLNGSRLADALGLAGMQASGLWQCRLEPGFAKQLAAGRAAQSGLIAADLAAGGFPAPHAMIEGELGFLSATAPGADPRAVAAQPDAAWRIFDTSFKPWPACRHAHPVIELGLALRDGLVPQAVERAEITTYRTAVDFCDDPRPDTAHRGRFSLQHCFAVALVRGVPWLEHFAREALDDPEIAGLRRRISVTACDHMTRAFPHRYPARAVVVLAGGGVREAQVVTARGDPENPMTEAEMDEKFVRAMEAAGCPRSAAEACKRAVESLPGADSLAQLSTALDVGRSVLAEGGHR